MDEDSRGLDSEWLILVARRLLESLDNAGPSGPPSPEWIARRSMWRLTTSAPASTRSGREAIRPIMRSCTLSVGSYPGDGPP